MSNENFESFSNPIDSVEEVLSRNDWTFNRMNDDELVVEVRGKSCGYKLYFFWQEDMNAMQFCCQFDVPVNEINRTVALGALMEINASLWLGHFDLPRETAVPSFCHTCLMHGVSRSASSEQIEELVRVALSQCESLYPLFHLLAQPEPCEAQALSLASMRAAGQS